MAPSCRRQSTHTSLRSGPRLPAISTSVCLNLGQQPAPHQSTCPNTSRRGQCNPAHVGRGRHGCHRITSHPYGALSTASTRRPSSPHPARYRRARCHRSPQGPLQGRPPSTYHPASDAQQREAYSGGARGGAAMPQGERTVRRAPSLGRRGMHVRRTRQMFRASTRRRTCCPSAVSSSRIHAEL